ncbi:GNAT family N-acetyltransferase [Puniceicoccaceae bacterium K14]|nr:GNAT family N-acetyltransferase [Puniceicoccaceae bacterium K14]
MLEPRTERLQLRQWKHSDRDAFASMSTDPQVMEYFPKTLSRIESDAIADKSEKLISERGWGVWAVELLESKDFIGMVGLHIPTAELPFSPCVEILWRLARSYWGNGYATEAANAVLRVGFEKLELEEIVAFAALKNKRSRAVMKRLGMVDTGETFTHPALPTNSSLREHCLYKISLKSEKNIKH